MQSAAMFHGNRLGMLLSVGAFAMSRLLQHYIPMAGQVAAHPLADPSSVFKTQLTEASYVLPPRI